MDTLQLSKTVGHRTDGMGRLHYVPILMEMASKDGVGRLIEIPADTEN